MKILKFGGSSLKTAETIRQVLSIIAEKKKKADLVVVVSALYGLTDELITFCHSASLSRDLIRSFAEEIAGRHQSLGIALIRSPRILRDYSQKLSELKEVFFQTAGLLMSESSHWNRLKDAILSYGEKFSSVLVSAALKDRGLNAVPVFADQVLVTSGDFGHATIDFVKSSARMNALREAVHEGKVPVVTGFIGSTPEGYTTTLGRNGSDYTATSLANLLHADLVEIWTDSNGILTADPDLYDKAVPLKHLSFREAKALSRYRNDVLHPRTIEPLEYKGIPLLIKNVYQPHHHGTIISFFNPRLDANWLVKSFVFSGNLLKISIISRKIAENQIFDALLDRLFQRLGIPSLVYPHELGADVYVPAEVKEQFILLLGSELVQTGYRIPFQIQISPKNFSFIGAIGENLHTNDQLEKEITGRLYRQTSQVQVRRDGQRPHAMEFFLDDVEPSGVLSLLHDYLYFRRRVHLFIAGASGKVGTSLLRRLEEWQNGENEVELVISGAINSTRMIISDNPIPAGEVLFRLAGGEKKNLDRFIRKISEFQEPAIFIDVTPSEEVARMYEKILLNGIGLVTANKIANASDETYYRQIHNIARLLKIPFYYETNVGSATPIIDLLQKLHGNHEEIYRIEALLSGTLAFIMNQVNEGIPFSAAILDAIERGYCEPDPMIDLAGKDAARKFVILLREIGFPVELEDIPVEALIPEEELLPDRSNLLQVAAARDQHWKIEAENARKAGKRLVYLAVFEPSGFSLRVEKVSESSIWAVGNLSENIFRVYLKDFPDTPLTLTGFGAGIEWTARGVFSDILKAAEDLKYTLSWEEIRTLENLEPKKEREKHRVGSTVLPAY